MGNRARGNARGAIRGCDRTTPQWSIGRRHPARSRPNEAGAAPRGSTNPSYESRPAEPGASCYVVGIRIDSSIADSDSRHRARSSRWNELGEEIGEVSHDAHLYDSRH
jgi:hypothetical protein